MSQDYDATHQRVRDHAARGHTSISVMAPTTLVDFGQRSEWRPDQSDHDGAWFREGRWLAAAAWFTTALGWVLATLVAAGFTNVVRRE